MSDLSMPVRVTAAKRLLVEGTMEYDGLSPRSRAFIQEAIEYLTQVESELAEDGVKK